jgi:two-component system C4-dicarboxylate transport response regulator DctD
MLNSVIVVDDEASIRTAVEQWLSLSGFSVQLFAAPKSAWRSCRALPGVILSDVRMPGHDGLQLLERLQRMTPTCR